MNVIFLTCVWLVQKLSNIPNEVEIDENYTPYNPKGTKIDGVELKHRGTPSTKKGLSNQLVCIITAIQRFGHTIAN